VVVSGCSFVSGLAISDNRYDILRHRCADEEAPMGRTPYWNDPEIAEQRAHELERALPATRKARKPRQERQTKGAGQQVSGPNAKTGQGDRSSAN
jgi:hypothetical protein